MDSIVIKPDVESLSALSPEERARTFEVSRIAWQRDMVPPSFCEAAALLYHRLGVAADFTYQCGHGEDYAKDMWAVFGSTNRVRAVWGMTGTVVLSLDAGSATDNMIEKWRDYVGQATIQA